MSIFKAKDWLDRVFEIGIVIKGLDGVIELVGGILLLLVSPGRIHHLVTWLVWSGFSGDPHEFLAVHLLHSADKLTGGSLLFASAYLLAHGLAKVVLVLAIIFNRLWAYPWMIALLLAFICYQGYRLVVSPSLGLGLLTLLDVIIVALTWREYRKLHRPPAGNNLDSGVMSRKS